MDEVRENALEGDSDEGLVEAARRAGRDDTRAFEELMRRHQGFVATNCRAITGSAADADDLAQEVFVKAFFGLRGFEGRARFRTWIGRIKVNHCLNHLRKTRGTVMVDLDDDTVERHEAGRTAPTAETAMDAAADRDRIVRVLDSMSDALRIPLLLRDADGLSYDDIAAELQIGQSAVKMRIKRAREQFRSRYGGGPAPGASP